MKRSTWSSPLWLIAISETSGGTSLTAGPPGVRRRPSSGRRAAPRRSLRVAEQRHDRQREDLQVERERPVGDVVVVPLDPLGQRGLPAQAVHLRPARDARPHAMAVAVADDVLAEELHELGTLRAGAHEA